MSEEKETCCICLWDDKNDIMYGDFKIARKGKDVVKAHYFCLLSGDEIPQNGTDKQGILGFLLNDIQSSVLKYRDRECYLCGMKSAAVKCAHKDCDRFFHYPCGTRNSCMTEFLGEFNSYCSRHVKDHNEGKKHGIGFCLACFDPLSSYNPADSIISSCCLLAPDWDQCFVHKKCVMRYTNNAGYDSMCINCDMKVVEGMTKEDWQKEMRMKGIFIPWKNAAWEEEEEYKEYFKKHVKNKCEYPHCLRPNVTKNVWTCFVCGCFPRHLKCAKVKTAEEYYCPNCYDQSFVQRVPKW